MNPSDGHVITERLRETIQIVCGDTFKTVARVFEKPNLDMVRQDQMDAVFIPEPDEVESVLGNEQVERHFLYDIYLAIIEWEEGSDAFLRVDNKVKTVRDAITMRLMVFDASWGARITNSEVKRRHGPTTIYPLQMYMLKVDIVTISQFAA